MYLIISIATFMISFWLFKRTGADMNPRGLNMISWVFYLHFVCYSLIGATLVVYNYDNYVTSSILYRYSDDIRFQGWLMVQYALLTFPLGILIAKAFWRIHELDHRNYIVARIYKTRQRTYPFLYVLSIVSILSCIYSIYISGRIGIINLICGNIAPTDRMDYIMHFKGNIYIRNILAQMLCPLLSMMWYVKMRVFQKRMDKRFFQIMMAFSIVILTQSYAKAPVIYYIISFLVLRICLLGRMSRKALCLSGSVMLIVLVFMYMNTSASQLIDLFSSYNTGIIGRIFFSEIAGFFKALEYFPSLHDHIGFASMSRQLANVFGVEYVNRSARIIMQLFNPKGVEDGIAGVMNSIFLAEAWANFGIVGLLLSPWIVGYITGTIYYMTIKKDNLMYIALSAYLTPLLPISGGFNDFIYPVGLLLPILCVVFVVLFSYKRLYRFE